MLQGERIIRAPLRVMAEAQGEDLTLSLPVPGAVAARVVDAGGAIIASHRAGLHPEGDRFTIDALGVEAVGDAEFQPDFIMPGEALGAEPPDAPHVMYMRAMHVRPQPGTDTLAPVHRPHFNRTWRHYCSHRHAPVAGPADYPGVTQRGRSIYFAHPIFNQYHDAAPPWVRSLLAHAINRLIASPLLTATGPDTLLTAVNRQAQPHRLVVHLLHYVPERRAERFDLVSDVIPLHDVSVSLRCAEPVKAVRLVPQGTPVDFQHAHGRAHFTVPVVQGHAMIELALE